MPPERPDRETHLPAQSFASLLAHLIGAVHPRGRGPFTNAELAKAVTAQGVNCTPQYIGQLRADKHAPSLEMAAALARALGVPINYFSDPDIARRTDEELAFLASLRDTRVTAIALRAADLSAEGLQTLHALIDRIRAEEGLPPEPQGSPRDERHGD